MQTKLSLALQKSGRLSDGCIALFQSAGIKIRRSNNQLLVQDEDFGIDFIFARDDDIPGLVENGVCDLGIIGESLLQEYNIDAAKVMVKLGFAKCRLSLAHIRGTKYSSIDDLNDKSIATSHPKILSKFLNENNIKSKVVTMHGSVELAPQIGIADVICDLVSSGATLKENGLMEFMVIASSEAVLISRHGDLPDQKQILLDRLLLRIKGVLQARQSRCIMMHIDRSRLSELREVLPGSESPTILELQGMPQKVAVHVVSLEEVFWDTIEKLKEIGASSILVLPIEKMIF